jgi:hypothetical protein
VDWASLAIWSGSGGPLLHLDWHAIFIFCDEIFRAMRLLFRPKLSSLLLTARDYAHNCHNHGDRCYVRRLCAWHLIHSTHRDFSFGSSGRLPGESPPSPQPESKAKVKKSPMMIVVNESPEGPKKLVFIHFVPRRERKDRNNRGNSVLGWLEEG